jgi:hypothetical protein
MKEKAKVELVGTLIEKLPLASVTEPFVVPLTITFTPGKVDPSSEDVTLPVITRSCAQALSTKANEKHNSKNFFIDFGLN